MNWSAKQEKRFRELEAERLQLQADRDKARNALANILGRLWDSRDCVLNLELAIKNADQLRDALAPFDSGIRSEPEKSA